MRIDILTLFPEAVDAMLRESIIGRARAQGLITIGCHQIREYTKNKQKQVDDYPYGGGMGMVMNADPLYNAWAHVVELLGCRPHTIYLSPQDEELSIGDFVLTGGEIPAMAVTDAICRMIPGVLSDEECFTEESHYSGLLEYPQYTRPAEWHGKAIPEILLSGHHANIKKWRRRESLRRTLEKRPDMLGDAELTPQDRLMLAEILTDSLEPKEDA